jgi:FkbM family methyltransferase
VLEARTRAGATIYANAADARGQQLAEHHGNLNPLTLDIWLRLLSERQWTHVLDVGANYGEMLVHGHLPERAKVLAIEPNPHVRPFLELTLAEAGIAAEVLPLALGDATGEVELLVDRGWSGTTRLARAGDAVGATHEKISVPAATLSDLLAGAGPLRDLHALVKIDVEGHELAVLEGLLPVLNQLASFTGLVEVLHVSPEDIRTLLDRFDVEMLDVESNHLEHVRPATYERFAEMPTYRQDVVVRRKKLTPADHSNALSIGTR